MFRSMLVRSSSSAKQAVIRRSFSSGSVPERKVAILGAAGGIGQPLALLMKLNPLVSSLSLYSIANTPGVAADVGHINTRSEVVGYMGDDNLAKALEGADLVIIPVGVPRKPVTLLLNHALINMISNPVNSTVPIAAEIFKKAGISKLIQAIYKLCFRHQDFKDYCCFGEGSEVRIAWNETT
uniref:malate dehydrogenase n=1 Tax=Arabidopsis halleri subsp. halleri TaxID=81971 RepID=I0J3E6_ARAHH|nr:mitochondrial malate dehydrogenase [Arabidopsis halleri subsp. halleri]